MDVSMGKFRRLAITGLLATSLFTGTQAALAQSTQLPADILFDDAESTNGWGTGTPNVISRNTESKKSGAASVQAVGASPSGRFSKSLSTPIDVSGMRYLTFWYYVDDPSLIALNSGQVEISSAGTFNQEESNWSVHDLHLHRGWNFVVLDLPGTPTAGGADLTRINFFRIYHNAGGSITTRIDRVAFTNREPESFAFSKLIENKRIAADYWQSASLMPMLTMIFEMPVNDPQRQKVCRQIQLDQLHREISAASLVKVGVAQNIVNNDVAKKKLIKDFLCGQGTASPEVVANVVSQSAQADVALAAEIGRLYDVTQQAAAEIRDRILELDLTRILGTCGADGNEINRFVETGALPGGMEGLSVLTPDCEGGAGEIALLLGGADPVISDRAGRFRQCMAQFTNQGSECNNPYASPDDDFNGKMKGLVPHFGQPYVDSAKQVMRNRLELIESTTIQNVNDRFTEPFNSTYEQNDPPLEETQPSSGQVPNYQEQVELHRQFDNARSKAYGAEKYEWQAERTLRSIPNESKPAQAEAEAFRERYHAERVKWELEAAKIQAQICENDPKNEICEFGPPPPPPEPEPENGPKPEARCANMEFEDGSAAWFNKPAGDSGLSRQINEGDRINHCLCDLFDRGYIDSLPGSEFNSTYSGCPTAEERIAQECLENPYGPNDGIRRECLHIMQPSSFDRDVLNARVCKALRPDCENGVFTDEDGSCGCAAAAPGGGGAVTLPSCPLALDCGPDAVPSAIGCGCQPIDSGGNACTNGGKDFYLTKNPLDDLLVRTFPTQPNIAGHNVLMVKPGDTRFVTAAIRRNQLFNASTFDLDLVLPAPSYSGTGSIEVRCSNVNTGTANRLIETISMQGMVAGALNSIRVNLDAAERTACYGSGNNNRVHFEFRVNTPANQPVGFTDILGGLGDIKPVCVRTPRPTPSPGPRPLSLWPDTWTFGDGQTIEPVFNGVGPITIPGGTLPGELCIEDGQIVPCD